MENEIIQVVLETLQGLSNGVDVQELINHYAMKKQNQYQREWRHNNPDRAHAYKITSAKNLLQRENYLVLNRADLPDMTPLHDAVLAGNLTSGQSLALAALLHGLGVE